MKKILLFLMILFAVSVNAQYFVLTETGLVPASDNDAKFIVIAKEGKTQEELFNQVKNFISSSYISPKDVMSVNGEEMITLNGLSNGDVQCKKGLGILPFKTNYTVVFMFKDGKIRINNPTINSMLATSTTLGGQLGGFYELTLTKNDRVASGREQIVVFKGKGKTTKETKESIEELFNTLIDKAVNFSSPSEEKW